jgi:hypothetical protein
MSDQNRRETDNASSPTFSLQRLIAGAEDESQRTIYLVLHEISLAHQANTKEMKRANDTQVELQKSVHELAKQFGDHTKSQEEFINKGKGAQIILRAIWGLAILCSGWFWSNYTNHQDEVEGRMLSMEMRVQKIENVDRMVKVFEGARDEQLVITKHKTTKGDQ